MGLASVPFSLLTAQPQPETDTRSYVLQLLTDLHSSQPGTASLAEQRLQQLGVTQDQLQFARLLKNPDRFERFRLVSLLPQIAEPLQTELRVELTRDVDREIRASVVNFTQPQMVTGTLATRFNEMLRDEPDSGIRRRVQHLVGNVPPQSPTQFQSGPAPLNTEQSRPMAAMRPPVQQLPIAVQAEVRRPTEVVAANPDISYVPPRPETTPTTVGPSHSVVNLPQPVRAAAAVPPSLARAQGSGNTTTSQLSPPLSNAIPDAQRLGPKSNQQPLGSSAPTPFAPALNNTIQPVAAESRQTGPVPRVLPVPATLMPLPQPAPVSTQLPQVDPFAQQPSPVTANVSPVPFQTTLFQNIGIPPAPAPNASPGVPGPEALFNSEPARLTVPGGRLVPAPAPAAESGPVGGSLSPLPAAQAVVQPLLAGPGGAALITDPLFQMQPDNGPTSSDDVGARRLLDRPIDQIIEPTPPPMALASDEMLTPEPDAPFGFTGPSGIIPNEEQTSPHFVPVHDRWRLGYEHQDRYGPLAAEVTGWKWGTGYLGVPGHWWDPYNQNVLKGDYPIIGQHTFLNVMLTSQTTFDFRQTPTGTTPFESTRGSNQEEFFGQPESTTLSQNFFMRFDLLHANNAAFKPLDWQFRITPAVNSNVFHSEELAVITPDVRQGRNRIRDHFVIQEYFAEFKLADISPDYDFVSVRTGNQLFNSDFRGFIFFDTNRAVRIFGSRFSNRHQFNLLFYDNVEKETNSGLNTTKDRHQNVLIANYFVQDFIWPGYTFQTSFHWNNDQPSREFDRNLFLVRPDPVGVFQPHRVEAYYFGIAGDGHIGRINVNNAFYWVTGRDGLNPIAGRTVDINAFMGALELSYDRDWARFRTSLFYSSGDDNPSDTDAEGFDSILDNPVFLGGEFSYWQRQAIQLFGVRLVNDRSLVPDLRSSGIQGQSNFVNPGIFIFNLGLDMDLTPKLRSITNANYIMFDETEVLSAYTFQGDIDKEVGLDISTGIEWRPFHNDNAIILAGVSALLPDEGFKDLYNEFNSGDTETLFAAFVDVILTY